MSWAPLFIAFLGCHLVGDFLLQTEWQANNKMGGLGADAVARSALLQHVAVYTAACLPALIWIGAEGGAALGAAAAAIVFLPHVAIDDGRLRHRYMSAVKGTPNPPPFWLDVAVDQSMHLVCLLAAALVLGALA